MYTHIYIFFFCGANARREVAREVSEIGCAYSSDQSPKETTKGEDLLPAQDQYTPAYTGISGLVPGLITPSVFSYLRCRRLGKFREKKKKKILGGHLIERNMPSNKTAHLLLPFASPETVWVRPAGTDENCNNFTLSLRMKKRNNPTFNLPLQIFSYFF